MVHVAEGNGDAQQAHNSVVPTAERAQEIQTAFQKAVAPSPFLPFSALFLTYLPSAMSETNFDTGIPALWGPKSIWRASPSKDAADLLLTPRSAKFAPPGGGTASVSNTGEFWMPVVQSRTQGLQPSDPVGECCLFFRAKPWDLKLRAQN
jgi:hypothetical protein